MEIASYDVRGTGPDTAAFERLGITSGQLAMGGLAVGSWIIRIDARNAAGVIVGRGEAAVQIRAASVTSATIDIRPLSGTGTLSLVVRWTRGAHRNITSQSALTALSTGVDLAPAFSPDAPGNPSRVSYSNAAIEAGYYLLSVRLSDAEGFFWGIAEAVRIVAGQSTEKTWTAPD
jgi:hypothetical protein